MMSFNEYINEAIIHDLHQEGIIREQRMRISRLYKENSELRSEIHTLRDLIGSSCPKTLEEFDRITVRTAPVNRMVDSNF